MKRRPSQDGYIMVTVLLALAVISLIGLSLLDQASSSLRIAAQTLERERALYAASAGVEHALARVVQLDRVTAPLSLTGTAGQASYFVAITPAAGGGATILATGSSGRSERKVRATLAGRTIPRAYYQAVFGASSLSVLDGLQICGDLFSNGEMALHKRVSVFKAGSAMGKGATCTGSSGGTASAAGAMLVQGALVEGGWCDASSYTGPPCNGQKPAPAPLPAADWQWLAQNSTRSYRRSCTGYVNCTPVPSGATVSLDNLRAAPGERLLVYVEGDLELKSLVNEGQITLVATGAIGIKGSAVPGGACQETTCSAAFLAQGPISLERNDLEIWGLLYTNHPGGVSLRTNGVIHGTVVARNITGGANNYLFADHPYYLNPPPGLPGVGEPGAPQLESWIEIR